jgi:DNA/RNA-binding domain of Phe-tRNA-synthetase-like protein
VKDRYPDLNLGIALIDGVEVRDKRSDELDKRIHEAVAAVKNIDLDAALASDAIGAYRALFADFGANPNATPPSPENILRMAVHEGRLPAVNNLVDATNLTVLESGISVAVYDRDKLSLPLTLRFAVDGDKHLPLGTKRVENAPAGELIYADAVEVICRALNHRDSDKTKVTNKTTNILLIVDGSPGIGVAALHDALDQNVARILQVAGGMLRARALLL